MEEPNVILVDENDNQIGVTGKIEAHRNALLHRAVSVFIISSNGDWILQRRAFDKYHSNGLWTNTCCTHPSPGESNLGSAKRRLKEEMGMDCNLMEIFTFTYKEKLDNELTEYEVDHVFFGICDTEPIPDTSEVEEWKVVSYKNLEQDIMINPSNYTCWFKEIYEKVNTYISHIINNPE